MRKLFLALLLAASCFAQTTASPQPYLNGAVTSATNVKASPGTLYAFMLGNTAATVCYLQIFNATAANVTLGTTVPVLSIPVALSSATVSGFMALSFPPVQFNVAISVAATTGATNGSACGTAMVVNLLYL